MKTEIKLLIGYIISLMMAIYLGVMDSDPVPQYSTYFFEIFVFSVVIWGVLVSVYAIVYQSIFWAKKIIS